MQVGVDEAGKGPALGSMFVAAVRAPRDALPDGVDDSKQLSADVREDLAARLSCSDHIEVGITEIPPSVIDTVNMTTVTVDGHADAITQVACRGDTIYCDAGEVNADRFARRVHRHLPHDLVVDAAHGADCDDALVGAASILAKTAREAHVMRLHSQFGTVGSGYPSDPVTRAFLRDHVADAGELPACARTSWATCEDVLEAAAQSHLDDF